MVFARVVELVLGTWYLVLGTWYLVLSTWYLVLDRVVDLVETTSSLNSMESRHRNKNC